MSATIPLGKVQSKLLTALSNKIYRYQKRNEQAWT
jgi:hypothetical protein